MNFTLTLFLCVAQGIYYSDLYFNAPCATATIIATSAIGKLYIMIVGFFKHNTASVAIKFITQVGESNSRY